MNPNVRALLQAYDRVLEVNACVPARVDDRVPAEATPAGHSEAHLDHARWMVQRMLAGAEAEGWSERKVCRWLGFIQGVLWSEGIVGILGLRDDSRHLYDEVSDA
jgi:hypothetical protein